MDLPGRQPSPWSLGLRPHSLPLLVTGLDVLSYDPIRLVAGSAATDTDYPFQFQPTRLALRTVNIPAACDSDFLLDSLQHSDRKTAAAEKISVL